MSGAGVALGSGVGVGAGVGVGVGVGAGVGVGLGVPVGARDVRPTAIWARGARAGVDRLAAQDRREDRGQELRPGRLTVIRTWWPSASLHGDGSQVSVTSAGVTGLAAPSGLGEHGAHHPVDVRVARLPCLEGRRVDRGLQCTGACRGLEGDLAAEDAGEIARTRRGSGAGSGAPGRAPPGPARGTVPDGRGRTAEPPMQCRAGVSSGWVVLVAARTRAEPGDGASPDPRRGPPQVP